MKALSFFRYFSSSAPQRLCARHSERVSAMSENEIGTIIVDSAIAIHRQLGPGLLESVYELVLAYELTSRGLQVQRQLPISIVYREMKFEDAFRADLLVADKVIIELKSVEVLNNAHRKSCKPTFGSPA